MQPKLQWFAGCAITLLAGVMCVVPQLSSAAEAQATSSESNHANSQSLPKVHLDGTYFARDGKRFMPVGAHWVPAKAAMQWPVQVGSQGYRSRLREDARAGLQHRAL